jgi:hypothetical protein
VPDQARRAHVSWLPVSEPGLAEYDSNRWPPGEKFSGDDQVTITLPRHHPSRSPVTTGMATGTTTSQRR